MRVTLMLALVFAAGLTVTPQALGDPILEQVVAFVDDEPIFLSQLRQRVRQHAAYSQPLPADEVKSESQLLDQLIDELLVRGQARRLGVSISDDDVSRAIEQLAAGVGLNKAGLLAEVKKQQGLSPGEYEAVIRTELLRLKVLAVSLRPVITEAEIRQAWEARATKFEPKVYYCLSAVAIALPKDAVPTEQQAAQRLAQALVEKLREAELSMEQAVEAEHGYVGLWMERGEVEEDLHDLFDGMAPGSFADPFVSGDHLVIYRLDQRKTTESPTFEAAREALRAELYEQKMQQEGERLMERLRRDACIIRRLAEK